MANNAQKIPFQGALNRFAEKKVLNAIHQLGQVLTCSVTDVQGSIVTVKFELDSVPFTLPSVTVPVFGPEYIRYPIQVGDKGIVLAADVRLGGITGLGSGNAGLTPPANLTALVFLPIANANWDPPDDPDKLELYGPQGVIIKKKGGQAIITVEDNQITIQTSGASIIITDTEVQIVGTLMINGSAYLAHKHSGVSTGTGTSGAVVP